MDDFLYQFFCGDYDPTPERDREDKALSGQSDQFGSAVILKNNAPRYIIYEFNQADAMQAAADDDVLASSLKLMDRNKRVYEELAK